MIVFIHRYNIPSFLFCHDCGNVDKGTNLFDNELIIFDESKGKRSLYGDSIGILLRGSFVVEDTVIILELQIELLLIDLKSKRTEWFL